MRTRRRFVTRALVALASLVVLTACSSSNALPDEQPVLEPGYPAYTPPDGVASPAQSSSPTPSSGPSADVATAAPSPSASPRPAAPGRTPVSTASQAPPVAPASPPGGTPSPTAAPSPTPSSSPSSSPSATPSPVTLQTATFTPECGGSVTIAHPNANLRLTIDPFDAVESGDLLNGTAVLTNAATAAVQVERYEASVVLLQESRVVALAPGGSEGGPRIALGAGASLVVPFLHDLRTECPLHGDASPTSQPEATATHVPSPADSAVTGTSLPTSTEVEDSDVTISGVSSPLPPGDYTVVVAVGVAGRDGVVAVASAPLTIR